MWGNCINSLMHNAEYKATYIYNSISFYTPSSSILLFSEGARY